MADIKLSDRDEHAHEKHLCSLAGRRQMLTVAKLAKNAKYVCALCGRAAAKAENLCSPVSLDEF